MTTGTAARRGDRAWRVLFAGSVVLLLGTGGGIAAGLAEEPSEGGVPVPVPAYALEPAPEPRPAATPTPKRKGTWTAQPATPQAASGGRSTNRTPERLEVPRLDLSLPVVVTGVDRDGQMALPKRPTEIGWYAFGPRPGDKSGSAVLGGHRDSRRYGTGPLTALERLRPGDDIVVVHASGRARFRVEGVESISKRALPVAKIFDRDGKPTLRILTCGGSFVRGRGYTDNVVVTARLR